MDVAKRFAENSYAKKLKVGCLIVTKDIMVPGYNGTPEGWDNNCEDKVFMHSSAGGWVSPEEIEAHWPYIGDHVGVDGRMVSGRYKLVTKPSVIHAEANAMAKMLKAGFSSKDADVFATHAPCLPCAKAMHGAGIARLVYGAAFSDDSGIKFLRDSGVIVTKMGE